MYKGYGLKLSDWFVQSRVLTAYGKSVAQMHSFGQSEYKQVVEAAKAGIAGLSPYDSKDNIDGNGILSEIQFNNETIDTLERSDDNYAILFILKDESGNKKAYSFYTDDFVTRSIALFPVGLNFFLVLLLC